MSWDVVSKYGLDMSGATDNAAKLATLFNDVYAIVKANKPLPRLVFTEGNLSFSKFPNFAFPYMEMVAEGQCNLQFTGTGDAVTFDPSPYTGLSYPSVPFIKFEGFNIYPNASGNGLVLNGLSTSSVDARVYNPGQNRAGVVMNFCILTQLRAYVGGVKNNNVGIIVDCWNGNAAMCSTSCDIIRPSVGGMSTGIWFKVCGSCKILSGSLEGCDVGLTMDNGGNNQFYGIEMENNSIWDFQTTAKAHDNFFILCNPKLKSNTSSGYNNQIWNGGPLTELFGL